MYVSVVVLIAYNKTRLSRSVTLHRAYNATVRSSNRFIDCVKCATKAGEKVRSRQAVKPERTHHCSVCKRCNLRMDHHCPFMQTCVAAHNHRYFIQVLTYGFIAGVACTAQLASDVIYRVRRDGVDTRDARMYAYAAGVVLLCVIQVSYACVCVCMGTKHWRFVRRNMTTLEDMKVHNRDAYDLGTLRNMREFFRDWPRALLPLNARVPYEAYFFHMRGVDAEFQSVVFHPDSLSAADPLAAGEEPTLQQLTEHYKEAEARSRKKATGPRVYLFNSVKIQE